MAEVGSRPDDEFVNLKDKYPELEGLLYALHDRAAELDNNLHHNIIDNRNHQKGRKVIERKLREIAKKYKIEIRMHAEGIDVDPAISKSLVIESWPEASTTQERIDQIRLFSEQMIAGMEEPAVISSIQREYAQVATQNSMHELLDSNKAFLVDTGGGNVQLMAGHPNLFPKNN